MRSTILALVVVLLVGCGGEEPSGDPGDGKSTVPGEGSPRPGPGGGADNWVKLTLSKVPKNFGIGSATPSVIFERSGFLLRPTGETWITFTTTEDYKDRTTEIEANTFLSGVGNYVLPLMWKPGTFELTAGESNYGDGKNVFHIGNGGTQERMESIARVPVGAKITVEIHTATTKVTRLEDMKIVQVETDIHLTAKHPLKVYHSSKMGAGWHKDAEVVDELEATLEVRYKGKLSLPDTGQEWLK